MGIAHDANTYLCILAFAIEFWYDSKESLQHANGLGHSEVGGGVIVYHQVLKRHTVHVIDKDIDYTLPLLHYARPMRETAHSGHSVHFNLC